MRPGDSPIEELASRTETAWILTRPGVAYAMKAYLLEEGRPERIITAVIQALTSAPSLMTKMEDLERDLRRCKSTVRILYPDTPGRPLSHLARADAADRTKPTARAPTRP